jgi:hypothetical protein
MARREDYFERYARELAAVNRLKRFEAEVENEQQRLTYLDSLVQNERANLTSLQQVFAVPPVDLAAVQTVLQQVGDAAAQRASIAAGSRAARVEATTLSKDERAAIMAGASVKGDAPGILRRATALITPEMTPEKATAIASYAATQAAKFVGPGQDLGGVQANLQRAAAQAKGRVPTGPGADTAAQAAASRALEQFAFAGPSGVRGGYGGLAIVERRAQTADELERSGDKAAADKLRASGFATQEDALQAALEVARATGDINKADPYARDIYIEARNKQAYRNDQRADFEEEILASRKRIAQLEAERGALDAAYDDPALEVLRRELEAQGYKIERKGSEDEWKNRYLEYQNTPLYDTLLKADRLVEDARTNARPLQPETTAQTKAVNLARAFDQAGTSYDIDVLREQLEKDKSLAAASIDDALAFLVAYRELGGDKQAPAKLEADGKAAQAAKAAEAQKAAAATQRIEALKAQRAEIEQRAAAANTAPATPQAGVALPAALQVGLGALPSAPPSAGTPAVAGTAAAAPTRLQDPTNTNYAYQARPQGGFDVFFKGQQSGVAAPGTRAAQSIANVLGGGEPLSASRPKPSPARSTQGPAPAVATRSAPVAAPLAPSPAATATPATPATPAPAFETTEQRIQRLMEASR